eukprot:2544357-Pyramimonas_sp.AAC.2
MTADPAHTHHHHHPTSSRPSDHSWVDHRRQEERKTTHRLTHSNISEMSTPLISLRRGSAIAPGILLVFPHPS